MSCPEPATGPIPARSSGFVRRSHIGRVVWAAILIAAAPLRAEDWPTYQHDAARSGITSEKVPVPLVESWVFQPRHAPEPAWGPPKSGPVENVLELPRNRFDDALQVAAADGRLYFGSSADGKVYCLDASTGQTLWTKITGGPVRLAPMVCEGRVYFGSDDGYAYCLDARTGSTVWQFRAAPEDKRVLGSRRMISLWPLRAGVLVDKGVAYVAAGIFPAEGVFFYALDAKDGTVIWRNDSGGEAPQSQVSPQGYLLASETTLFAPMGRVSPAALDRRDGKLKYLAYFGKTVGGTYALVSNGDVYTGTEELLAYRGDSKARLASYPGQKIIVAKDTVYLAGMTRLSALDRKAYPAASNKVQSLRSQLRTLQEAAKKKSPLPPADAAKAETLPKQIKAAEEEMARAVRWEVPCRLHEALILAGDVLVAGGAGQVQAIDSGSGKTVWTGKVDGMAKGLAAAGGQLYVSTDSGKIYCFGDEGSPRHGSVGAIHRPGSVQGLAAGPAAPASGRDHPEADRHPPRVLPGPGLRDRPACPGIGTAHRTDDLRCLARRREGRRGPQGPRRCGRLWQRVYVEQFPLDRIPYSDYFANLIVSETALVAGKWPCRQEHVSADAQTARRRGTSGEDGKTD